jgi:Fe-S cluster assembly protein SufD
MTQVVESNNNYLRELTGTDEASRGPAWAQSLKSAARARFAEVGFPTRRDEEWKYTSVAPIVETPFKLSDEPATVTVDQIAPYGLEGLDHVLLVFVNGRFVPHLSALTELREGVQIASLADIAATGDAGVQEHLGKYVKYEANPFVALNTAVLGDGAYLNIPRNVVIEQPIHFLFVSAPTAEPTVSHPRNLVVAGENSQATIVESYIGIDSLPSREGAGVGSDAVYFTNSVTEFVCAENAVIDHYKVQRESMASFHISTTQIDLKRSANFRSHAINLGGSLVRNDINAVLGGEGIECTLNGLYMARENQLVDNHTFIDHAMPHCPSHELYKGIIDGKGRGVFNGKILVRQDAQKTDAKQTNQTLLLSDDAQINTKPQLEIYADDVKCTHGATVGQISDEALFYLRTRGIDKDVARDLLTYAFASDIVSRIRVEPIRAQLDHVLLSERALEGIEH